MTVEELNEAIDLNQKKQFVLAQLEIELDTKRSEIIREQLKSKRKGIFSRAKSKDCKVYPLEGGLVFDSPLKFKIIFHLNGVYRVVIESASFESAHHLQMLVDTVKFILGSRT